MKTLNIKQTTWNLSPLLNGDDDPSIEEKKKICKKQAYQFIDRWKNQDGYLQNPRILKQALDEYEALSRNFGTSGSIGYYFGLRTEQDQNNPKLKAKLNQSSEFGKKIENDINFFGLRLAKIPPSKQKEFLKDKNLQDYHHFLEKLFNESKYLLSEDEEKIINLKSDTSYHNWVQMTAGFLSKEEREILQGDSKVTKKNFSEIISLIDNKNKKVRNSAALAFNDILLKYLEVAEIELNSILANKKVDDELRKIPRPDLPRHLEDDIESKIVDALITAVSNKFDIPRRFYALKAKLLRLKKLEYHERNVEYGNLNKHYSYEQAVNLVHKVLAQLDPDFAEILINFVIKGQIDVYPKPGKRNGAFCTFNLLTQPVYILLNFTNKLDDVSTLAHEVGHGINDELMRRKQNSLNFSSPLSTAEVASTFMEDFVLEELLKEAGDEQRLIIMMMKLNDDISTIFRQISCYKFEQELHQNFREKGYLPKEEIGKLFQKHMKAYMGDSVEQSPGSENWWVYWSHIRNFFYNYSYANGLLISKSLQASVRKNPEFINKVKNFLAAGTSNSPKNIFASLGIDITDQKFWNQGLNEVEDLLKAAEALAKKLGKLKP